MKIRPADHGLNGSILPPGDKSISHRALMFGAIATGRTEVEELLKGEDVRATISVLRHLGVEIIEKEKGLVIEGKGFQGLKKPQTGLDFGNSGTSMRLMSGILAGQHFESRLLGDPSLSKRPMDRVATPLRLMGAEVEGEGKRDFPPLRLKGGELEGIKYESPLASAQVKSAVLLAGLQAYGRTVLVEKKPSRNHTEEMLVKFGGQIEIGNRMLQIKGGQHLVGTQIRVPGDISSASFWIVAGLLVPGSDLILKQVGLNPTRTGILEVIQRMGGDIEVASLGPDLGDLHIRSSRPGNLKGVEISGELIPRLIDEIPIIALLATQVEGETVIRDAADLKHKESNRIARVAEILQAMGGNVEAKEDGLLILGPTPLKGGGKIRAGWDHRIGMMGVIAGLLSDQPVEILGEETISSSYPGFFKDLERLCQLY